MIPALRPALSKTEDCLIIANVIWTHNASPDQRGLFEPLNQSHVLVLSFTSVYVALLPPVRHTLETQKYPAPESFARSAS